MKEPVEPAPAASPAPPDESASAAAEKKKRRREKEKLQSAWISFAGRIVAQVVGALATVALGLLVADRIRRPGDGRGLPAPREVSSPSAASQASIAVLPLANLSGNPEQDYLADGLTEALITDLARVHSLKVISRTSVMLYKTSPKPVPDIGRELGVAYVLEGSVVEAGGRMRVTAQLIDASTDRHLWAETYDRKASDILALQDDVSRRIAREVNVVLTPDELARFSRGRPVDPENHALYLQGRYELHKGGPTNAAKAIDTFNAVLARDPSHAPALTGLAEAWLSVGQSVSGNADPRQALPRAREAAERAAASDPDLAGPHVVLASILYQNERKFAEAERELNRALVLSPGNVPARRALSLLLANLGRGEEAIAEARRVLEMDPLSPGLRQSLAVVLYFAGRFDEAEKQGRAAREGGAEGGEFREFVAEVQLASGRPQAAIEEMKRVFGGEPDSDGARAIWGAAHAAAGEKGVARRILDEMTRQASTRYVAPRTFLILEVSLGLKDDAFRAIDRALEEGSDIVHILKVHPLLAPLRKDPRYQAMLKRAGFPAA